VTVAAWLEELRSRDIKVWADGDLLRCSAPPGTLTPELRGQLQIRKSEILQFLKSAKALARQHRGIVPLQSRGTRTPVFATAGHNGDVFCYRTLVGHLGDDQPFYGLQPPGLDGREEPLTTVEDLAAYFASEIRAFRPDGPYIIGGYCAGGALAFELARQLARDPGVVSSLVLFGSPYPSWYRFLPQMRYRLGQRVEWAKTHARALAAMSYAEGRAYVGDKLRARIAQREAALQAVPDQVMVFREKVGNATLAAIRRYRPRPFSGRLMMLWPSDEWLVRFRTGLRQWQAMAQAMEIQCGPAGCPSDQMLLEPYVATFAELFRRCRDQAEANKALPMSERETDHQAADASTLLVTTAATNPGAGDRLLMRHPH
jgi:thioesterase domain-containing protein